MRKVDCRGVEVMEGTRGMRRQGHFSGFLKGAYSLASVFLISPERNWRKVVVLGTSRYGGIPHTPVVKEEN